MEFVLDLIVICICFVLIAEKKPIEVTENICSEKKPPIKYSVKESSAYRVNRVREYWDEELSAWSEEKYGTEELPEDLKMPLCYTAPGQQPGWNLDKNGNLLKGAALEKRKRKLGMIE